jgi:hypothetical protein
LEPKLHRVTALAPPKQCGSSSATLVGAPFSSDFCMIEMVKNVNGKSRKLSQSFFQKLCTAHYSVADPDPDLFGRIRTLGPDPGLNKLPYLNFFGVCKSHNTLRNPYCFNGTFWFTNILFRAYFRHKNFQKKLGRKLFLVQDPDSDPDVFKSRIRIRSKIVRIRNISSLYHKD